MTLPAKTDLKSFVTGCLERSGGLVEEAGYALVQAVLPEDLALGESLLLAFDYAVARENPQALFVAYGSQFLDNVARLAAHYGRFAVAYHPGLASSRTGTMTGRSPKRWSSRAAALPGWSTSGRPCTLSGAFTF